MYRQVVTMCIYNNLFQHTILDGYGYIKSFLDIAFVGVLLCALF